MKRTVPTYCHNSGTQNGQRQGLLRFGLPITTHVILKIQKNICQVSKQSLCFTKLKRSTKFWNVCTENLLQNTDIPPNMDESEHNISKFFFVQITSCNMQTLSYPQVWLSQYAGIFVSACPHPQQVVVLFLWCLVDASQVQLHSSLQSRVLHRKTYNR